MNLCRKFRSTYVDQPTRGLTHNGEIAMIESTTRNNCAEKIRPNVLGIYKRNEIYLANEFITHKMK